MKRNVRKILAVVATLSMSCAALSVNAATAEITDIKVKTGSNPGTEETVQMGASAGTGFEANASKLVTLKITLKEASALLPNNAATFITYKDGSVYNDSTIQYIDQKTTDTNGIVTITFRPRAALADGNYVLKASGAGVTAPVVGYYKIVNIKEAPVLAAPAAVTIGNDVAISMTGYTAGWNNETTQVFVDGVLLTKDITSGAVNDYAIAETTAGNGTLTIHTGDTKAVKTTGTHSVVVKSTGYNDTVAVSFDVNAVPLPSADTEAQGNLNKLAFTGGLTAVSAGTLPLPTKLVTTASTPTGYDIAWTVSAAGGSVEPTTGVYTAPTVTDFAQSFTLTATVVVNASQTVTKDFKVFVKKDATPLSFGNVEAVSDGTQQDITKDTATLKAFAQDAGNAAKIAEMKVQALNVALGRVDTSTVAGGIATIDNNKDNNVTLSDFKVIDLMLSLNPDFSIEDIQAAMAAIIN